MDNVDQELFRVLRITVIFYGFLLLLIWIYSQITNQWGNIWLKNLMLLLIILMICSASVKYILGNKTLIGIFKQVKKHLENHPKLSKIFRAVYTYSKLKKKFRKYYFVIIFLSLLIIIIWIIANQYIH